ncbi:MAG: VOC family protein [Beutenbergiaceae bacterium]
MDRLAAETAMGSVELLVRDLDAMTAYYADGVGLTVRSATGAEVVLGWQQDMVRLVQRSDLPDFSRGDAGLFHTAIVFATAADLATAIAGVARRYPRSFTGSADHLVSEAFYFDDPEGNGVELYLDRPRSQWQRTATGGVAMATNFLDPNTFLAEHLDESRDSGDSVVGHVHLQVGDIPTAEAFYADLLGFDVTARYGRQALFVAAGGYHHHIGLNTWNSAGAGPRAASLGLAQLAIDVPTGDDLQSLELRLAKAGRPWQRRDETVYFADPWQTQIAVSALTW